jgi:hypothetical protein
MSFANGHPKTGGRKKGSRNKRTLDAAPRLDALDHIEKVMATDDGTISPDVRLRAAIALAMYQHPRLSPSHTEAFVTVDSYTSPKTPDEARQAILTLGERLAQGEVSVQAHDALVGGLKAYLSDKAAEQQRRLDELEDALRQEESQ